MNYKLVLLTMSLLGAFMPLATAQVEKTEEAEPEFIDQSVEPEGVAHYYPPKRPRLQSHWNIREAIKHPLNYNNLGIHNPKEDLEVYLDSIHRFENLETLLINRKEIERLPLTIVALKLKKLELSHNKFDRIPKEIFQLPSLEFLKMDYNQIDSIGADLGRLEQMVELSMSHNSIHHLTSEIGQLQRLEKLNLHRNFIHRLPSSIGKLKRLKYLRLSNNAFIDFPPQDLKLDSLQELILGSAYTFHKNDTLQLADGQIIARTDSLHLTDAIVNMPRLEYLRIQACEKTKLSEKLFNIKTLRTVVLHHVDPEEAFVAQMFQAPQLESIEIDSYVRSIPNDLRAMQNLKTLRISSRSLKQVPPTISQLKQLEQLLLPDCKLTEIPDEIVDLSQLEKLDLKENKLTSLPENIGQMKSLRRLQLSDNQLTELPVSILKLKDLIYIDVSGNPMSKEYILALKQMLPQTNVHVRKWPD